MTHIKKIIYNDSPDDGDGVVGGVIAGALIGADEGAAFEGAIIGALLGGVGENLAKLTLVMLEMSSSQLRWQLGRMRLGSWTS